MKVHLSAIAGTAMASLAGLLRGGASLATSVTLWGALCFAVTRAALVYGLARG